MYPQGKIKIICIADNIAACKCYTNVFGKPFATSLLLDKYFVKNFIIFYRMQKKVANT
jgi:hypothetical protein